MEGGLSCVCVREKGGRKEEKVGVEMFGGGQKRPSRKTIVGIQERLLS